MHGGKQEWILDVHVHVNLGDALKNVLFHSGTRCSSHCSQATTFNKEEACRYTCTHMLVTHMYVVVLWVCVSVRMFTGLIIHVGVQTWRKKIKIDRILSCVLLLS